VEALTYITYLALILVAGFLLSLLAKKIRVPTSLLLILLGVLLHYINFNGKPLMQFNPSFLSGIGILALVMILFEKSSRFKIKEFDTMYSKAFNFSVLFLALNIILLSLLAYFLFGIENIFFALIFAIIVSGSDLNFPKLKLKASKALETLRIEAIFNLPIILLLPFLVLDIVNSSMEFSNILRQIMYFLQHAVIGVGIGIFIAIIFFKVLKKYYSEKLFPLAIVVAAFLSYIMAENLQGNGALAVTTLGLFFGNMYLKGKPILEEFSGILFNSLEILVFVLLGLMISIDFTALFFIKSLLIFFIIVIVRYLSILIAFSNDEFSIRQKIFMSLNAPKGLSVAILAFVFLLQEISGFDIIVSLTFLIIVYSLVFSTVMNHFSSYFLENKEK